MMLQRDFNRALKSPLVITTSKFLTKNFISSSARVDECSTARVVGSKVLQIPLDRLANSRWPGNHRAGLSLPDERNIYNGACSR